MTTVFFAQHSQVYLHYVMFTPNTAEVRLQMITLTRYGCYIGRKQYIALSFTSSTTIRFSKPPDY